MVVSESHACTRFESAHEVSQEAIETISLWILHYKDKQSIDTLVGSWLKVFKRTNSETNRIALFYIMNDAVQKAKNKHFDYLIAAFQPAVLSAITVARTATKVKKIMQRCIEIFREREVFTNASVTAMFNILHGAETGEIDDGCLELNNSEVCMNIEAFEEGCKTADDLKELVLDTKFETFQIIRMRLTDKRAAYEELERSQQVYDTLVDVRHALEAQKKRMLELVETLEIAKRLYAHSLKEVTVVEDAYQKFYHGIKDTQKELLEMQRTGVYPAATPPRDCPSPTDNDDIFARDFNMTTNGDNLETADMEMDDDDHDGALVALAGAMTAPPGHLPPFLQNFNRPPPNLWPPSIPGTAGAPSGVPPRIPPNFSLPPPQLISPPTNNLLSPPGLPTTPGGLASTNFPPPGMFPPPNMTIPPGGMPPNMAPPGHIPQPMGTVPLIPTEGVPRDPRQLQQSPFNGLQRPSLMNINTQLPPGLTQPSGSQIQPQYHSQQPQQLHNMGQSQDNNTGAMEQTNQRFTPYKDGRHSMDGFQDRREGYGGRPKGNYNRQNSENGGFNRRESFDNERGPGCGSRDPRPRFNGRNDGYRGGNNRGNNNGYRNNNNSERWDNNRRQS